MESFRLAIVRAAEEVRPAFVFDRLAQSGRSYGIASLTFGRANIYRMGRGFSVLVNNIARGTGMTRGAAIRDAALSGGIDVNADIDEGILRRGEPWPE